MISIFLYLILYYTIGISLIASMSEGDFSFSNPVMALVILPMLWPIILIILGVEIVKSIHSDIKGVIEDVFEKL